MAPWSYELTAGENPAYPITSQSAYMIGGTKGSLQFPNLKYWFYKKERSWWNKIFVKKANKKIMSKQWIFIGQSLNFNLFSSFCTFGYCCKNFERD